MLQQRPSGDAHPAEITGVQTDEHVQVAQSVQIPVDEPPTPSGNLERVLEGGQGALDSTSHLAELQTVANNADHIVTPTTAPASDTSSPVPEPSVLGEAHHHAGRASMSAISSQVALSSVHSEPWPQTPSSAVHPAHKRSLTMSTGHTVSVVLISSALETILSSREAKRSPPLRDSAQNALEMVRAGKGGDRPREIFEPLRLASETRNEKLMIASLDCISKLISYSFFAEESSAPLLPSPPPSPMLQGRRSMSASQSNIPQPSLVDLVVHTITACHTETTPETVSLQVVKALLSLILSPTILVHHSSLLKAVRTVYNIFLLSTDPVNQMVAQGGLTQMVHHVFTRCRSGKSVESDEGTTLRSSVSSEILASPAHHHLASDTGSPRSSSIPSQPVSDSMHVGTIETGDTHEDTSTSPEQGSADSPAEQISHTPLDDQGGSEEG